MNSREVRSSVEEFRQNYASSPRVEHCFAPWYLNQAFQGLPAQQAIDQSSDGSYDYSIDGFQLFKDVEGIPHLVLVQAKLSDSIRLVAEGFRNFEKCLPDLANNIDGLGSDLSTQNKVLYSLRDAIARLDEESRKKVHLEFRVIHLSEEDSVLIGEKTKNARDELADKIKEILPDHFASITDVPPSKMASVGRIVSPPLRIKLSVTGLQSIPLATGDRMYYGMAKLSELVDLYGKKRENLFSRNVRYFIDTKANKEKGPAGKMRDTLKEICYIQKEGQAKEPEIFAFYHNGISLTSRHVDPAEDGLELSDPFVLNGCQTIKNAFFFRYQRTTKDKIDTGRWKQVVVPVRIVETNKDELVREVTVNNNRQNAITAAALHANDQVQLDLEARFEKAGIFYERQQGAYDAIANSDAKFLNDNFRKTYTKCYVEIETLARMICAVAKEITFAEHPTHLFESEKYNECFSEKRLASIPLLVCLQNMHDVIGPILKNDLALRQVGEGPTPNRLRYYTLYLLAQYLAKTSNQDFVERYGEVCGQVRGFREEVVKLLKESGIKDELKTRLIRVEKNSAILLNQALDSSERSLRLGKFNPFNAFQYAKAVP